MKRETGYYWVLQDRNWEPAAWNGENWLLISSLYRLMDNNLLEIDEQQITRRVHRDQLPTIIAGVNFKNELHNLENLTNPK